MKAVLEFGVRGGQLCESLVVPSLTLGAELASNMVRVFTNDQANPAAKRDVWKLAKHHPRQTWQSSTHFVSLSVLDGVPRGPASAGLWKKP